MNDKQAVSVADGRQMVINPASTSFAKEIIEENRRRNKALEEVYDPVKGVGCTGRRVPAADTRLGNVIPQDERDAMIPEEMMRDPEVELVGHGSRRRAKRLGCVADWVKCRCRYDFEYWAARCAVIRDKKSGRDVSFILNRPQRRVLALLESQRLAGEPIRVIMLKARQWGGSTLIQMYMAWIQIAVRRNWHSLICSHIKDTSATIRGMYSKLLDNYPAAYWPGDAKGRLQSYEGSRNIQLIAGRGCKITVGTSENHDGIRGGDFAMAHLSEVAFWKDTRLSTPEQFIRAICGSVNYDALTLVALESTANGVGNYFHREWLRSKAGDSDKMTVFVPWYENDIYRRAVADEAALIRSMDEYEWGLWERGLTLEMINWYHRKRREYQDEQMMHAEYPTTDTEAFVATSRSVFGTDECERLRQSCREPAAVGEIEGRTPVGRESLAGVCFVETARGNLRVWRFPDRSADNFGRYVVAVDIGGRSVGSDWSVIVVLDRRGGEDGVVAEVAAQWRGHCDPDMLAWRAARIAQYYGTALLVFESNSYEAREGGDVGMYVLNEVMMWYPNLFYRSGIEGCSGRPGFHTNQRTKPMVISRLMAIVRDGRYIEHDSGTVDEFAAYRILDSGGYGAAAGSHDDCLMARAIGLHVLETTQTFDC